MHTKSGAPYATLANSVSKAIADAVDAGMDIDEAVSVTVQVGADYWRGMAVGDLETLAQVVIARGEIPLPFGDEEIATRYASLHLIQKPH